MLKKTFEYEDYNGNKRKEDAYFNLSYVELQRILNSKKGGLEVALNEMINTEDMPGLFAFIEKIILSSYGRKLEDGGFEKSEELSKKFSFTIPYDLIFEEITSSEENMTKFLMQVIPAEQAAKLKAELAKKTTETK